MKDITVVGNNEVSPENEAKLAFRKRDREIMGKKLPADLPMVIQSQFNSWDGVQKEALDPKERPLWDLDLLKIPYIWSHYAARGVGVTVHSIDSGINSMHPAFLGKTIKAKSFLQGIDSFSDGTGHGTWVAGKIAGRGVGVAPEASLSCFRVLDDNGCGSSKFTNAALAAALADDSTEIVNLSMGSPIKCEEQCKLVWRLYRKGVLVVAASGNRGNDKDFYPACFDGVLSVGAIDKNESRADFSDFGGKLQIVAPGVSCYGPFLGTTYRKMEGTSMAAPIVSGVLALALGYLKKRKPDLSKVQLRDTLLNAVRSTAKDLGPVGRDVQFGFGGLNPVSLFEALT